MRLFFRASLFVAIMIAFQPIKQSIAGDPMAGHFAVAAGEKMGNPLFNEGAMVCANMQNVQLAVQAITRFRADLLRQQSLGNQQPDPAVFGCTIVPNGTRVFVEKFVLPLVPQISIEDSGGAVTIRGVTLSNMLNFTR
jgi:hypothetical protein